MSNIFDALKKWNVVDLQDLARLDLNEKKTVETAASVPPSVNPFAWSRQVSRVVSLGIPAVSPLLPFHVGQEAASEQYRIIRTRILHHSRKPKFLLVTSASSGDGKTVTAINMAGSFALSEEACVLLIDGDLRRPRVSEALDIPQAPGLADVLSGKCDLKAAIVRAEQFPNLFILPAGEAQGHAAELLDSVWWRVLVQQLRTSFSIVICDGPPAAVVADYDLLQATSDGTVLVARPDHTGRAACMKALEAIGRERLLGVVLNCVEDWWLWKTPAYGYYGKASSKGRP